MSQNIIECLREASINKLFATNGFKTAWPIWQAEIRKLAPAPTQHQVLALGDHLRDI